jgi:hypothetical protein
MKQDYPEKTTDLSQVKRNIVESGVKHHRPNSHHKSYELARIVHSLIQVNFAKNIENLLP